MIDAPVHKHMHVEDDHAQMKDYSDCIHCKFMVLQSLACEFLNQEISAKAKVSPFKKTCVYGK